MAEETTSYPHIRSRPSLPCRFINIGGNTLHLHGKLRLIAYVLVFLHASFAVFFLNAGFAHAQNTIQVSESAQKQEKPQISLTPAERAWLDKSHTVRVRVGNHPPWQINTPAPRGMCVDYLTILGEQFGIDFKFIPDKEPWIEGFNDIAGEHLKFDLYPTAKRTPERLEYLAMSDNYLFSPWVMFTRKETQGIERLADLRGRKVSVERGYVMHKLLKKDEPEIVLVTREGTADALLALSTGKADAYIGNLIVTSYLIQNKGITNLKVAGPTPFGDHSQAMVTRKEWAPLISIINKGLKRMPTKEKTRIQNKYIPVRFEHGITAKDILKRILLVVGAASGILLLLLFWNRVLKRQVRASTSELTAVNKSLENEIGEHRRAEEKLRYQATLLENVSDAVISVDMDFKIRSWNDAAEDIYGWKAEEVMGQLLREVTALEYLDENREEVLDKIQRQGAWWGERIQSRKDGKRIVVQTTLSSIKGKEGVPLGLVSVNRDITIRKQAEEALRDSQEEARELAGKLITSQEAERKRLACELHDDITQRLALLNIEVDKLELQHKSLSEPIKEKLRQLGDNLGELASDIQMISRQLHPSILDDLGLIQAIESECNNFARLLEIPVTSDLDTTLHNLSKETALSIYRILQEGLRNIGRHARATDIQVQLSKKNNTVYFVLKDNGIGFELDSSTKRRGLGLASVKERARLINGDLSIESRPGKGTVIKLEVPLAARHED